nr:putative cytochrome c biogenesis ccmB-like mitochondrial protein [Ipomoea trifida]
MAAPPMVDTNHSHSSSQNQPALLLNFVSFCALKYNLPSPSASPEEQHLAHLPHHKAMNHHTTSDDSNRKIVGRAHTVPPSPDEGGSVPNRRPGKEPAEEQNPEVHEVFDEDEGHGENIPVSPEGPIRIPPLFPFPSAPFPRNEKEDGTLELYYLSAYCLPKILLLQLPGNGISPSSCFSCANVTVAAQHEPSSSAYALPPQRATANPGEISLLLASMEAEPRWRMSYAIDDGGVQQLPLTAFSFSSDVATVSDGGLSFPLLSATSPSPATEATAQLGGSPSSPGNGISPSSCFSCANVTVAAQHEPSSSAYALPPQRATANPGEISLLLASMEAEPRWRMSYAIDDGGVQQLPLTAFSFSSDVATVSDGGLSFPLLSATSPSPATEATAQLGGSPSSVRW